MAPRAERRTTVLVVAGSRVTDELRLLLDEGSTRVLAAEGCSTEAEGTSGAEGPADVVVVELPLLAGVDRCRAPMLALIRRDSTEDLATALEAGALDVVGVPLVALEVVGRVAMAARLGRAERRLAQVEAWAGRAAHDLASPLAVISMVAETLHDSWDRLEEADRGRLLASIRNQAARSRAMLDEAGAVARDEEARVSGSNPSASGPIT